MANLIIDLRLYLNSFLELILLSEYLLILLVVAHVELLVVINPEVVINPLVVINPDVLLGNVESLQYVRTCEAAGSGSANLVCDHSFSNDLR